jgi:hypothetical protein
MSLAAASPLQGASASFAPRRLRARCAGARAVPRRVVLPATAASAPLDAHGRRAALVAGAAAAAATLLPLRADAVQVRPRLTDATDAHRAAAPPRTPRARIRTAGGRASHPCFTFARYSAASRAARRATASLRFLLCASLRTLTRRSPQGLVPGRIPGLGKEDGEGFRLYTRPEGKSGGHGVGWSEIPPYSFRVHNTWEEIPVSIADLGGAEVDLRFQDKEEGDVSVVVAPVARFADIGFNASVRLQELVTPEQLISGFAPELIGLPLQEGDVVTQATVEKNGLLYYTYELKPKHLLVTATAFKNRLFILTVSATPRQWRKEGVQAHLRATADSFQVKNT